MKIKIKILSKKIYFIEAWRVVNSAVWYYDFIIKLNCGFMVIG